MPWPQKILNAFATTRADKESTYYGPYNMVLEELFPSDDGFMVCPQHQVESRNDSVDLVMTYVVERESHPVFFMEVKVPGDINNRSTRASADSQMRQRYEEIYPELGYPLHAACALGTRLCFYSASPPEGVIEPRAVQRDPYRVNDVAPASRWAHDLLTAEGEAALKSVASHVRDVAGKLARVTGGAGY